MTLQVEGTNDSSSLSKCSAVSRGYFCDDFLYNFVKKCPRRAPLIHLGYSVRAVIINTLIEEFVDIGPSLKQIVSFGAGFDTLYFKLKRKNPNISIDYYELDLPRVVKRKMMCIEQSPVLKQIIGKQRECQDGLFSKDYKLLAVDLRDMKALEDLFERSGLDRILPTLFLSECAITYLEENRSSDLIRFASGFEHATFVTYEQIHPEDGFGLVMLQHFDSLQSPLLSVKQHPTLELQKQRYIKHNWKHCTSVSALEAYNEITTEEERQRVLHLEPFDEWEEFYLKCVHYAVTIASQGSLSNWSKLCKTPRPHREPTIKKELKWKLVETKGTSRYGHAVAHYNDKILLIGGFGVGENGAHGRMKEIVWLKSKGPDWDIYQETEAPKYATMYTSWTAVSSESYVVYGGRTSPMHFSHKSPEIATVQPDGTITSVPLVEGFDMPPRWRHSAVVAKCDNVDTFLVFGGRTSDLMLLNDTWMVPLLSESSERRVVKMTSQTVEPCARFSHSAAVRQSDSGNDEMWVTCGLGDAGPLADVWSLNLATHSWRQLSVPGLLPRFSHSSSLLQNSLLLVGGVNGLDDCQPGVAVIDLLTGLCIEYRLPAMNLGKTLILANHCHVISEDKKTLWIVGGGGNCFSFGTFFNKHCSAISLKDLGL